MCSLIRKEMNICLVLTILLAFGWPLYVQGQEQCGVTSVPTFSDPGNSVPVLPYRRQVIIPSYQFTCCGVVTRWGAFVQPGGSFDTTVYTATFQVWRPTDNGSTYELVGENVYTNPITLVTNSELRVTAREPLIAFQPNDVVGYHLDSTRESGGDRGVQLDTSSTEQTVYYSRGYKSLSFDTNAVDVARTENRGLPILLVGVESRDCFTGNTATTTGGTEPGGAVDSSLAAILTPSLPAAFLLGFLTATSLFIIRALVLRRQKREEDTADFQRRLNESVCIQHSGSGALYETITDHVGGAFVGGALNGNIGAVTNPLFSEQIAESAQSGEGGICLQTNHAYSLGDANEPGTEEEGDYSNPVDTCTASYEQLSELPAVLTA